MKKTLKIKSKFYSDEGTVVTVWKNDLIIKQSDRAIALNKKEWENIVHFVTESRNETVQKIKRGLQEVVEGKTKPFKKKMRE